MGEVVNALWARCPDCDHKWIVAHLPIEVMTMVHLAKVAACPRGCDGKPLVASTTPSRDEVSHVGCFNPRPRTGGDMRPRYTDAILEETRHD